MPKKLENKEDHLFKRGEIWWLYYRAGGQRIRISLKTKNKQKALKELQKYRIAGSGTNFSGVPFENILLKYIAAEEGSYNFTPSTARSTYWSVHKSAERLSVQWIGDIIPTSPQQIYDMLQTNSEATARTAAMRWHAFMKWLHKHEYIHIEPSAVEYSKRRRVPRRTHTVSWDQARELIAMNADRQDLQFVLYCAFFAGMRRNEIVMSRPHWFRCREIQIPADEETEVTFSLRNPDRTFKQSFRWRTKSHLARKIPIHAEFRAFLDIYRVNGSLVFPPPPALPDPALPTNSLPPYVPPPPLFMLHDEAHGQIYRWDPRGPFEKAVENHRQRYPSALPPKVGMHTARHSFISALANSGNFSVTQISMWSGDQIRTIEANYMHPQVRGNELDIL